jgi:acyl carrier protein
MDEKTLNERVNHIIAEKLHCCAININPLASFKDDLGADSLDRIELIMAFEDEFGIEISDEDADKINTVENAVEYIKTCTKKEDNLFF